MMKDKNPTIKWEIIGRAYPYNNKSKKCNLCMSEKMRIIYYDQPHKLLNQRNELLQICRHQTKFILQYNKYNEDIPDDT